MNRARSRVRSTARLVSVERGFSLRVTADRLERLTRRLGPGSLRNAALELLARLSTSPLNQHDAKLVRASGIVGPCRRAASFQHSRSFFLPGECRPSSSRVRMHRISRQRFLVLGGRFAEPVGITAVTSEVCSASGRRRCQRRRGEGYDSASRIGQSARSQLRCGPGQNVTRHELG